MIFSIEAIIDRIEGNKAILEIANDPKNKLSRQELIWPRHCLPPNVQEGDVVSLGLLKKADATKEKEELAQELLNNLLSKSDDSNDQRKS